MLLNYIKSAVRNLYRYFRVTAINFTGLTIAFLITILISTYVYQQMNVDRFNENYDDIYRLELENWAVIPSGVAPMVKQNFPEVESITRISLTWWKNVFNYDDKLFSVKDMIYSDNDFFDIFSLKVLSGKKEELLTHPFSLVLTKELADKMFPGEDPVGKTVRFNNRFLFTVTGVIEGRDDFHIPFPAIADFTSLKDIRGNGNEEFLTSLGPRNYLAYLINRNNNPEALTEKINSFFMGKGFWNKDNPSDFLLRDFSSIYLTEGISHEMGCVHGSKKVVNAFIVVAILVLFIAGINYVNITTVRGLSRFKEIGVRKIVGADKQGVFAQFIVESVVMCLLALLFSIFIASLVTEPLFLYLTGKEMSIAMLPIEIMLLIFGISLLSGIVAAAYPSISLAAISPLKLFRQESNTASGKKYMRQSLIVLQFIISIILIIGAIAVNKQYRYMKNARLGFNPDQIMTLHLERDVRQNREAMIKELEKLPSVIGVTASQQIPGNLRSTMTYQMDDVREEFRYEYVDPDYDDLLELEMAQGRFFNWDIQGDKENTMVLNEKAVEAFQLNPDSVVGSILTVYNSDYRIIGILKDYHFNSLYDAIEPLGLRWLEPGLVKLNVKVSAEDMKGTISDIQSIWNEFAPGYPFEYEFVDERFEEVYKKEERLMVLFSVFAVLAIIISLIGIYGLSSYMAEQNTRQISIRKVYGAPVREIMRKFVKEFLWLIALSNLVAWPLAFYIIDLWMQKFPYQSETGILPYIFAGLLSLTLSVLTVAFHAYKTANKNPAEVLRWE